MGYKSDRRDFLKQAALAGVAVTLGDKLSLAKASTKLVKIQGSGVSRDLSQAVQKVLQPLGGMSSFVRKGQTVLLKPNMGFPTPPEQRATTSPDLVAAVSREVQACGAKQVLILDNPVRRPEACMRTIGIPEAVKVCDVKRLWAL